MGWGSLVMSLSLHSSSHLRKPTKIIRIWVNNQHSNDRNRKFCQIWMIVFYLWLFCIIFCPVMNLICHWHTYEEHFIRTKTIHHSSFNMVHTIQIKLIFQLEIVPKCFKTKKRSIWLMLDWKIQFGFEIEDSERPSHNTN